MCSLKTKRLTAFPSSPGSPWKIETISEWRKYFKECAQILEYPIFLNSPALRPSLQVLGPRWSPGTLGVRRVRTPAAPRLHYQVAPPQLQGRGGQRAQRAPEPRALLYYRSNRTRNCPGGGGGVIQWVSRAVFVFFSNSHFKSSEFIFDKYISRHFFQLNKTNTNLPPTLLIHLLCIWVLWKVIITINMIK